MGNPVSPILIGKPGFQKPRVITVLVPNDVAGNFKSVDVHFGSSLSRVLPSLKVPQLFGKDPDLIWVDANGWVHLWFCLQSLFTSGLFNFGSTAPLVRLSCSCVV
jgi:hypothetical protein